MVKSAVANSELWMVLRALVPTPAGAAPDARSYFMLICPTGAAWQKMTVRIWGFKTADGIAFTKDLPGYIDMLQFVKTGTWKHSRILIDPMQASPHPLVSRHAGSADQPVIVDFRQNIGRPLTQIGFNLAPDALELHTDLQQCAALTKLTKALTP